mgnify:CR=1 FL=1
MSFLTTIAEFLGAGGEVLLALSVGLTAWYLVKILALGKTAGSIITSGVRMLAFAIAFLAVGIWRNWWEPDFGKLINDAIGVVQTILDYGLQIVDRLLELGVIS